LGIVCRSDITPPEKNDLIIANPLLHRQQILVDGLCILWITCQLVWKNVEKNKHEVKLFPLPEISETELEHVQKE
jgi:hypothetical protein